jgi:hypothetical protein
MSEAVFFFGGFLSSPSDIDKWLRSARLQKPAVKFKGFPWPEGARPDAHSAVKGFSKGGKLDSAIDEIEKTSVDTIYIVGHSSGCAIANAVDAGVDSDDQIVLVALDGFKPSDSQLAREDTQVWGAECQGQRSRNYPGPAKGRRMVYTATNCKSEWPLHFSLVNTNASDANKALVGGDITQGYFNCRANLCFLGRSMELR